MSKRFAAIALAAASVLSFGASAQEASGGIMGNAKPGDTVEIVAPDIAVRREISVTAENGKYQVRRLPIGTYTVTVKHADGTTDQPKKVAVRTGTTTRVK